MPDDLNLKLVIRAENRSGPAIRRTRRGLDSISDGLARIQRVAAGALLAGGAAGVFAALQRGAGGAVRSFSEVEDGLVGVAKTANLSSAEVARLERRIADLSINPAIGLARPALLEIAQAAGQLGVQGVDNLTRFTATIAKLQGASDLVGAEGATALARILNVTGEGAERIDRLGSVIVRLGNTFAASESEITAAATRVATATARFPVSSAQAAALGTALRALGIEGERAIAVYGTLATQARTLSAALESASDEVERNTALNEEALRAAGTFSRQMQLVRNEIDLQASVLGGALAPALLGVARHWEGLGLVVAGVGARLAVAGAQRVATTVRELAAERAAAIERTRLLTQRAAERVAQTAAEVTAAQAAQRHARASLASQRSIEGQRRATVALAAATTRLDAARRADAVSTSLQSRAQQAHNLTLSRARVLARGLRGAIGLLGGPIGALTTALSVGATAWALWGRAAEEALDQRIDAVLSAREGVIGQIGGLIEEQRARLAELAAERDRILARFEVSPEDIMLGDDGGLGAVDAAIAAAEERLRRLGAYLEELRAQQRARPSRSSRRCAASPSSRSARARTPSPISGAPRRSGSPRPRRRPSAPRRPARRCSRGSPRGPTRSPPRTSGPAARSTPGRRAPAPRSTPGHRAPPRPRLPTPSSPRSRPSAGRGRPRRKPSGACARPPMRRRARPAPSRSTAPRPWTPARRSSARPATRCGAWRMGSSSSRERASSRSPISPIPSSPIWRASRHGARSSKRSGSGAISSAASSSLVRWATPAASPGR